MRRQIILNRTTYHVKFSFNITFFFVTDVPTFLNFDTFSKDLHISYK